MVNDMNRETKQPPFKASGEAQRPPIPAAKAAEAPKWQPFAALKILPDDPAEQSALLDNTFFIRFDRNSVPIEVRYRRTRYHDGYGWANNGLALIRADNGIKLPGKPLEWAVKTG
jgi:hypothetical protein